MRTPLLRARKRRKAQRPTLAEHMRWIIDRARYYSGLVWNRCKLLRLRDLDFRNIRDPNRRNEQMTDTSIQTDPRIDRFHEASERVHSAYEAEGRKVFSDLEDAIMMAGKTLMLLGALLDNASPTQNHAHVPILKFLLARALKTFRSVTVLGGEGMGQDALQLLRSLIETVLTFKYIVAKETDVRLERFREYAAIDQEAKLAKLEKYQPERAAEVFATEQMRSQIRANANAFRQKYKVKDPRTWADKGLGGMSGEPGVDMASEYIQGYMSYSLFTHPTILSGEHYGSRPGGLPSAMPSNLHALDAVILASNYATTLVESFLKHFGLDTPDRRATIAEIRENILARMVWAGYPAPDDVKQSIAFITKRTWGRKRAPNSADSV
jgi:hypothetical protein